MNKLNFLSKASLSIIILLFLSSMSCDKDKFIAEGRNVSLYPFSGIGLIRENSLDTIDVWYSKATLTDGVNEVIHEVITSDTVIGFHNSWVTYEFGTWNNNPYTRFLPDYSEQGDHFFKVCNRGKEEIFYFIVPHPELPPFQGHDYQYKIKYKSNFIYDLLFEEGKLNHDNLDMVASLYKQHDQDAETLFRVDIQYNSGLERVEPLSRSLRSFDEGHNNKNNGKAFYYGVIFDSECFEATSELGIMLEGVQKPSYWD